jgi:hypothetical protein
MQSPSPYQPFRRQAQAGMDYLVVIRHHCRNRVYSDRTSSTVG